jgi:hypothetical protein
MSWVDWFVIGLWLLVAVAAVVNGLLAAGRARNGR